jgi:hypothetical protein
MAVKLNSGEQLRADIEALLDAEGMDLDPREARFLDEAVLTANLLDALQAVVDKDGPTVTLNGVVSIHPAVVELRLSRQVLLRMLGGIEVPGGKPNSLASQHGRRAAQARHGNLRQARVASAGVR